MRYLFIPLLFLYGCVSVPKEETECSLLVSPSLEKTIDEGVAQNILVEALPPCQWWNLFEDETLSYLIEVALQANPSLQEAMAKVERATNEAKVKRADLFPFIGLRGHVNIQHIPEFSLLRAFAITVPGNDDEYFLGLDFTYEFDFWGKRKNLYRAALGEVKAQEAEKVQADLLISTSLAAAYFNFQADREKYHLILKQEELWGSLVELRKQRQMHALDNASEVLEAENALSMTRKSGVISRQLIAIDRHLLLSLLGEGPEAEEFICPASFDSLVRVPIPEYLGCDLLAYRPDLMAQIWRVEAAALEVGAAKADFYPNINLSALGKIDTVFYEKFFSSGARGYSVEPAFHLPIFTAGKIKANLEEKWAILEEEIMSYNSLLLNAAKDVADRIVDLKAADEDLALQKEIVDNRKKSSQLAEDRFQHALNNRLDVLSSRLDLIEQQWGEVEDKRQYYLAAIQLIRALGGGYQGLTYDE